MTARQPSMGRVEKTIKRISALCFFLLIFSAVCFGQSNKTESLAISTYYPSPKGIYRTLRFLPNNAAVQDNDCPTEGEVSYNETMHELYICKGVQPKWQKFGSVSESGAAMKIQSGHGVSPDQCSDPAVPPGLCTGRWGMYIAFDPAFNSTPQVIVAPEVVSDHVLTPCAQGHSDNIYVYLQSVDKNGFYVRGMGSPIDNADCGSGPPPTEGFRTRIRLGWIAIGE